MTKDGLPTLIKQKEVTFDKFRSMFAKRLPLISSVRCSLCWPHFRLKYKRDFDPSRVFTKIHSCIKGGKQTTECDGGILTLEDYSSLEEVRNSTLRKKERESIYSIFQVYEKKKTKRGEFDWSDVVIDLHRRFKRSNMKVI